MRIIAGRFRGKKLVSPTDNNIRPTSDRVREAVFNIVSNRIGPEFSGHRVLDLFAGTGALGIEALSRGADYAVFVDNGTLARGLIRQHMQDFALGGQSRLLRRDATHLGPVAPFKPFTLIFCDPPYGQGFGEKAVLSALQNGWLAPEALVIIEERKGTNIVLPGQFALLDQRNYGKTSVGIYTLETSGQAD